MHGHEYPLSDGIECPACPNTNVRLAMPITDTTMHEGADTLSVKKTLSFPNDWDQYSLTVFMDKLERQAVATFANIRIQVQPILDVDETLIKQVPTIFDRPQKHEQAGAMLFTRMFSVLRAAARLVFAGQQYEARVVLRSALECGVYGWALTTDKSLREVWQSRDDNDKTRKVARNALQWCSLKTALRNESPQIEKKIAVIYDNLIDLGAHPNPGGIVDGMFSSVDAEGSPMLMTLFGGGTPESITAGLDELLRVTHAGFELLRLAMPERLERTGVGQKVVAIFAAAGYS